MKFRMFLSLQEEKVRNEFKWKSRVHYTDLHKNKKSIGNLDIWVWVRLNVLKADLYVLKAFSLLIIVEAKLLRAILKFELIFVWRPQ